MTEGNNSTVQKTKCRECSCVFVCDVCGNTTQLLREIILVDKRIDMLERRLEKHGIK